jgi:hypothetical protein
MQRELEQATGEERAKRERQMQEARGRGDFGTQRLFVGSMDRMAIVRLKDTAGRDRIRISVDSSNTPKIEFLDEEGEVVYAIPE